jgi:hypothetical protein
MLDYSFTLRTLDGMVTLDKRSARYVPSSAGVYQVVVVPFSFAAGNQETGIQNYLSAVADLKLDHREPLQATTKLSHNGLDLQLRRSAVRNVPRIHVNDDFVRKAASFFPPVYIGQSEDLKSRFLQHCLGINSSVREQLEGLQLDPLLCFFRWHTCSVANLDALETLLLQAHRPLFNKQLR